MTRINVVATVDVFTVDRQTHSREEFENPLKDDKSCSFISFGRTSIMRIGLWEHRHIHRNGAVVVMNANEKEYSS